MRIFSCPKNPSTTAPLASLSWTLLEQLTYLPSHRAAPPKITVCLFNIAVDIQLHSKNIYYDCNTATTGKTTSSPTQTSTPPSPPQSHILSGVFDHNYVCDDNNGAVDITPFSTTSWPSPSPSWSMSATLMSTSADTQATPASPFPTPSATRQPPRRSRPRVR